MKEKSRNNLTIEKIKELRKSKKLTQEEMANHLNMSKSSYIRLENEETDLSLDVTDKIAHLLKTDFNSLTNSTLTYNNNIQTNVILQQGNITIFNMDKEQFDALIERIPLSKQN